MTKNKKKFYRNIGNYLKKAREGAGYSQLGVSRKLGFQTPQYISNYERGLTIPSNQLIKKLIQLYKLSPQSVIEFLLAEQKKLLDAELGSKKSTA